MPRPQAHAGYPAAPPLQGTPGSNPAAADLPAAGQPATAVPAMTLAQHIDTVLAGAAADRLPLAEATAATGTGSQGLLPAAPPVAKSHANHSI